MLYLYSDEDFKKGYKYAKEKLEEKKRASVVQKVMGIMILALGVTSIPVLNMDITAALIFIPAGLYLIFTKKSFIEY